ncbi:hypothetical protein BT67DRAFT_434522 [Trichocladium antarcticum]|uniref:Uncharacterized protein n=1 Tax=Trichocladium antarcticum TaxID=1450529 RepID=A0AAN6UJ18_9PEZI|nr:hypothetical protein BT67DRAFT_434522 [Trichocladium antarcticum]
MKHITALVALIGAANAVAIPTAGNHLSTRQAPQDLPDLNSLPDDMVLIEIPDDDNGTPDANPTHGQQGPKKREPLRLGGKKIASSNGDDGGGRGGRAGGDFAKNVAAGVVADSIVTGATEAAGAVVKRTPLGFGRKKGGSPDSNNGDNRGGGSAAGEFGKDVAAGVAADAVVLGGAEAVNAVAKRNPAFGRKKGSSSSNNNNSDGGGRGGAAGEFGKDVAAEAANAAIQKRTPLIRVETDSSGGFKSPFPLSGTLPNLLASSLGSKTAEKREPRRFGFGGKSSDKSDSKADGADGPNNGGSSDGGSSDTASKFGSTGSGVGGLLKGGAAVATITQESGNEQGSENSTAAAVQKREPSPRFAIFGNLFRGMFKTGTDVATDVAVESATTNGNNEKRSEASQRRSDTPGKKLGKQLGKAIREQQTSGATEAIARHGTLAYAAATGLAVAMVFGAL